MKIREAKIRDISECLAIQKMWEDNFNTKDDFLFSIKDKDAFFLVAVDEDKVIGFILGSRNLVKRGEAYLQMTMVNPNLKRRGIGKKLVQEFCKYLKIKEIKFIFTELEKEHIPFYISSCKFEDRGSHVLAMKKL
jgi:ribosomal protein S18 acetylase RimI-like enzyme